MTNVGDLMMVASPSCFRGGKLANLLGDYEQGPVSGVVVADFWDRTMLDIERLDTACQRMVRWMGKWVTEFAVRHKIFRWKGEGCGDGQIRDDPTR